MNPSEYDSLVAAMVDYIENMPSGLYQASVLRDNFHALHPEFTDVSDIDLGYIIKWLGVQKKRCSKGVIYILPEGFTVPESKLADLKRRLVVKASQPTETKPTTQPQAPTVNPTQTEPPTPTESLNLNPTPEIRQEPEPTLTEEPIDIMPRSEHIAFKDFFQHNRFGRALTCWACGEGKPETLRPTPVRDISYWLCPGCLEQLRKIEI